MTTNTVQKATLAVAATVLALVVVGYFAMAPPVAAQTSNNTATSTSNLQTRLGAGMMLGAALRQGGPGMLGGLAAAQNQVDVSVGQTITITSSSGKYFVAGSPSTNGTASGTLTFTVTGKLASGYTLSVSGGSLTVAGTTYTVTSGTAQMGRGAATIVGQGATDQSGTFLLRASAHGSFVGSTGTMSLDLQSGSSEYLVFLAGSISS